MADIDEWNEADDALVRRAMATLRRDVEAAPMPDVRFVKARGRALRRRRFLTVGAAAAAAVIVASGVGYAVWGPTADQSPVVPATRSTSSSSSASPSPTTTGSLGQASPLPLLTEWSDTLGLPNGSRLTDQDPKSDDFRTFDCLTSVPNGLTQRQQITLDNGKFEGGQALFELGSGTDPSTVADQLVTDIEGCQQGPDYKATKQSESNGVTTLSFTAGDAGSGWWAVVTGPRAVTLISFTASIESDAEYTQQQVAALGAIARQRLERYGAGASGTGTSAPSSSTDATSAGPKAVNEKMPVSGPDPVPSSNLFVAASQWRDPLFYSGAKPSAASADPLASLAIVDCETDDQQAGIAGRVGVVAVQAGPDDYLIGKQRVRLFDDADADQLADADVTRVGELVMKGCTKGGNKVTAEAGPKPGTYLLTTKVTTEASGTTYQYVGVTRMRTPGAVSVITFHGTGDGQGFQGTKAQGFAQLDRLLALARQK
ncbi:hypothetical protein [Knoellia koreensis]|uniref:Uncharacterized protein n=1 Tax=Knoellia koreensis TaxID=2730921 RepID=A0A849HJ11_9MICO|nr:hypothetical protein [Knoellia sp. DB2414S]NNM46554.1 hypothetical protein [Knoellia sp. DB2414S]